MRTLEKFGRFLARDDEVIALIVLEMLPLEVRDVTANFYKFWTKWLQLQMSTIDAEDLTTALVS